MVNFIEGPHKVYVGHIYRTIVLQVFHNGLVMIDQLGSFTLLLYKAMMIVDVIQYAEIAMTSSRI